jgi:hypothetical protein
MDREGGVVVYGGRFRAVAYVARRPWATVFRAIDEQDGGVVALSVVSPGAAPGEDFAELLAEEVALLDGVEHPNLLPVLASGQDQDSHYVAEEWVEGPTLAEVVAARGPLPAERVAAMLADLAEGLAVAHAAGVVHGGPAPADVWLVGGPGGAARLHGLALLRAVVLASAEAGLPPAGDRPYLAPERLSGGVGAPGADLYGLGALTFEALCGVPPFGRDGRAAGVDPPWPSDFVDGIPEGFDDIVLDLLEEDPADRYHDALELREELEPFVRSGGSRARSGVAAGAAGVVGVAVADAFVGDAEPFLGDAETDAPAVPDRSGASVAEAEAMDHEPEVEASGADLLVPPPPLDDHEVVGDAALVPPAEPDAGPAVDPVAGAPVVAAEADESWDDDDLWEPLEAEWEPDPAVDWQPEVVTPVVEWEPTEVVPGVPEQPPALRSDDPTAALDEVPGDGEAWHEEAWEDDDEVEVWDAAAEDGVAEAGTEWDGAVTEDPDGVEPQRWEQPAAPGSDAPSWVNPSSSHLDDEGGWERWTDEDDDELVDDAVPYPDGEPGWQTPLPAPGDGGGGRRISPLLGAGIVAVVLVVIAAGLFAFGQLRGGDGESADPTTSTTAATTTSTTAATTTTVVGTGPLTEVPNTIGVGVFQAADQLSAAGFLPLVERRIDPAGQGVVVEQDPPSGMVPQGSTVRIVFTDVEEAPADAEGAPSTDTTAAAF